MKALTVLSGGTPPGASAQALEFHLVKGEELQERQAPAPERPKVAPELEALGIVLSSLFRFLE